MTPDGPFQPPFPGPWLALSGDECTAFAERLDRHLQAAGLAGPPFSRQCPLQRVHAVPLAFYPGWLLLSVEVLAADGERANADVLLGPGFLWCADGESTMLHTLNAGRVPMPPGADGAERLLASPLAPLEPRLTAPQYLRTFCRLVRGDGGSFQVVQTADDLRDCGVVGEPDRLAALLKPLRAAWRRGDAASRGPRHVRVNAPIFYAGSLHQARFEIDPAGRVTMLSDTPLAQDVAPAERTRRWLRSIRSAGPAQPR